MLGAEDLVTSIWGGGPCTLLTQPVTVSSLSRHPKVSADNHLVSSGRIQFHPIWTIMLKRQFYIYEPGFGNYQSIHAKRPLRGCGRGRKGTVCPPVSCEEGKLGLMAPPPNVWVFLSIQGSSQQEKPENITMISRSGIPSIFKLYFTSRALASVALLGEC